MKVDFNSTNQDGGPHPHAAFQSYNAGHEVPGDFVPQTYSADLGSGPVNVTVTPAWPNTTAAQVQQMIDRTPGYDAQWVGDEIDLITDWIGVDSRVGLGGNGDWDRVSGTPTYLTLTLSGLPMGDFRWVSYHHDTENVWADFQVEVSTDGGATYGAPLDMEMTSSSTGGAPANPSRQTGASDPDPRNLGATFMATINATGADVVLRFAPFWDGGPNGVHKQLFAMNAFELDGAGSIGVNYCVANANSTGAPAAISAMGSRSVGAADLVLHVDSVPNQPGIFLIGDDQQQIPWGNGFSCVGGTGQWIYPPIFASQNRAELLLSGAGLTPGTVVAGSTWHFQFLYRDPFGGGAQFSSSDGLTLTFVP